MLEEKVKEQLKDIGAGIIGLALAAGIAYGAYHVFFKQTDCCRIANCQSGYYCGDLPNKKCECEVDIDIAHRW